MQGLFRFAQPTLETLEVRPAQLADRAVLNALTENTHRVHFNLDWWTFDHWLYAERPSDAIWLAYFQEELVGLLLVPDDASPTAWVRALAIANGITAEPIATALFNAVRSALQADNIEQIAMLGHPAWVSDLAHRLNFIVHTQIVTMRKSDRAMPAPGAQTVSLRAATLCDLERLAAIDRAAFAATWWHSEQTLVHIYQAVPHFIVAVREEAVVGYAFSDVYGGQGHLIRLVVDPHYQRQGIGEQLLRASLDFQFQTGAGPLTLNTQIDNLASQALYARYGYQVIGRPVSVLHCTAA